MEAGGLQRYAVSVIPENGKNAGWILDHEHEPADNEIFLGALQ
jgi:hypothetical protein